MAPEPEDKGKAASAGEDKGKTPPPAAEDTGKSTPPAHKPAASSRPKRAAKKARQPVARQGAGSAVEREWDADYRVGRRIWPD